MKLKNTNIYMGWRFKCTNSKPIMAKEVAPFSFSLIIFITNLVYSPHLNILYCI